MAVCSRFSSVAVAAVVALWVAGCGSSSVRKAPGKPPTPRSISVEEPGGDAHDPHAAALGRLLSEPWGRRNDKDDQLHAPTPDWEHWKRVRFWGVEHFTGFRYGDDHHAVAIVLLDDMPEGAAQNSEACSVQFEKRAMERLRSYDAELGPIGTNDLRWHGDPLIVRFVDGHVDTGFKRRYFSAAWAAYAAYPDTCLVYAVAIPWRDQQDLARQVRDRWVDEGFQQLRPLTKERPFRHE